MRYKYINELFIHELCHYNDCLNWFTHLLQQMKR